MEVRLIDSKKLITVIYAIRKCYKSEDKIDSYVSLPSGTTYLGPNDAKRLKKVISDGHTSTLEHIDWTFEVDGISRAILQELARHRMASLSVESTRFCLSRIIAGEANIADYLVDTNDDALNELTKDAINNLVEFHRAHPEIKNDKLKYAIPENFKTNLIWTINGRSMRNFLQLRMSKRAHPEIQKLAWSAYHAIPEHDRILFFDFVGKANEAE